MKTREDELDLGGAKIPLERKEAVIRVSEVLRKTEARIERSRNKKERRRFQLNAIEAIELILAKCKEEFFIDELEENLSVDEAWIAVRDFFALERKNIENRKLFYVV